MIGERKAWTAAEVEILRNRHARQWTFSEIAAELGRSRNSCIAKADKLGLVRPECRSTQCRKGWDRRQAEREIVT